MLDGLGSIPEVTSVYAKLPYDIIGGGRAGSVVPTVDWDFAATYIQSARERGLTFCYLLNAPCLGNLEQTEEGKQQIIALVNRLIGIGVDSVAIANLAVVSLVHRSFPELSIRGSVLSWPTNLQRLQYQESLGVNPLILPYSEFNRDFRMLPIIRSGVSSGIHLFVNVACIYNCHYLAEHATSVGHASQTHQSGHQVKSFLDFYLWQCTRRRLLHPELFLMSRWIRPEDLHVYEAMGFDEFKIIDRSRSTKWLLRVTKAYADRRYTGNLLDILSLEMLGDPLGFHQDIEQQTRERMRHYDTAERQLMLRMLKLRRRLLHLDIFIDNAGLVDFLNEFQSIRCSEISCKDCGYCFRVAQKVVTYDRGEANVLAEDIGLLLEDFLRL